MTNMGRIEVSVAPVPPQPAAPQPAPVETRPVVQSSPVVVAPPAIATRPAVRAESLSMLCRRYFSWRVLGTALAVVWALGIVVGLARLLIGAILVWRLKRSSEPSVSARVLNSATNAARLLGLRDTPEIRVSSLTVSPMVMGVARPAILLPSGLEERLDDAHLAAALLHETGHIAHRDTLIGLFQRVAATLFWWCPLVHLVNRRLDDLREDICDNYVIRAQGDGLCLAQVLVHVAERTQDWARMRWIGAMAMTEPTGKGFEGRVRRLLQKERSTVTRMNLAAVCATMTFAALLGGAILATTVRAADKSEDAANAKTPELRVRPAKQQGQFDLELRMPDKRSSPRMIVEAGNWGMLEVALGEAAQLTFRARVNTEKQPVRVSCLVTVAVTGGFHQWILDDEPWPLGEWKALKETAASQPAAPGAIMHGDLVDGGRARVVIQTSRRIRPTDADDWRTAEAIAPMVAVAELQSGLESRDLLRILRATFAREGPPAEMANPWILALGPVLDSSDTVAVTSMEQEGDVLQVSVDYTSARVRGVNLRANAVYRPLCIVPIPQSVPAGKYRLVTTWRCVDQPAKGGKLPAPLVMKTEFVYAYAQEPPPADFWGRAVNGLQTRLSAAKDRVNAGEPIRLKLELRNVGTENRSYDSQQVAVNNPLIVRGPKGEEIPFVARRVSTLGGGHSIKPGETVVLFDALDATGQYLLTAPGVHTFQFRGRKAIAFLGEGETSIPPSNTIRVELTGEPPATGPAAAETNQRLTLAQVQLEQARERAERIKRMCANGLATVNEAMAAEADVRRAEIGLQILSADAPGKARLHSELLQIEVTECERKLERVRARFEAGQANRDELAAAKAALAKARAKLAADAQPRQERLREQDLTAPATGPAAAPGAREPAAGVVRVRILSGSDRDPARDAVEEWIAKGLADAGSPVTSALTDWITLSGNERELYSSMQGGRIIKGRVNDKGEVEITGMKIGQSPRIIAVRSGLKQVVKLTNYPGAGNVFLAVESVAVAASTTRPAAADRAATLLGDLKTFTLQLNYSGQQEKPYYHLLLSVPPLPGRDRDNPFYRQARVTEQQAKAIIEHLVKDGYFEDALDGNRNRAPARPKEPYYTLVVRVENGGNPVQFEQWLPLDSPLLYQRLDGLRGVLEGDAAKDMDLLIGRLAGERRALKQPADTRPAAKDAATQPAMNPAAIDPKTASLADALTDWIALLEKDDVNAAINRWVRDAPACHKMTTNWKALRECHKQHDYRRWLENSSDESTAQLVPGGAKRIGKDTTFRVGGHGFGHLHVMWEKTRSGWRIASILECN
jgi:beta-lactamase regulating signal transducer with metallopeptidase domain